MIEIDINNCLSETIGLRNGIGRKVLTNFISKNKSFSGKVSRSKAKDGYAFLELPDDTTLLKKIQTFSKSQQKKWDSIIVLGIGGSALGGIAIRDALLGSFHLLRKKPHLFFIDNVDPDLVSELFNSIDLKKSLFIVISKSGGTTEPMALYSLIKKELVKKKVKHLNKHFIFITDPKKGLLRPIGKKEGIKMFDVPPKVGGRFSVLSSVGLLPVAMAGIDIASLMKGAKKMREKIKKSKAINNPALILASLQFLLDKRRGKPMTIMMPYSNPLFRFGDWYRQLLAESLGKNKRVGPTPINALGTTDQHSQLQLYSQGPEDKFIIFLKVLKHQKELKLGNDMPEALNFLNEKSLGDILSAAHQGTAQSIAKSKRPNITLRIPEINEENLGALFMLFEYQVALLGLMYKVDAFNQPGVEQSKLITKKILSSQK